MNNQLGWASIKQSEKLVEAGLDPNTADMNYFNWDKTTDEPFVSDVHENLIDYTPCWSIGALIGLLPKTIETKKPENLYFPEILPASNGIAYTALNENKEYVFLKLFATGVESDATLIDNMVSMICWLLENNYIKNGNKL